MSLHEQFADDLALHALGALQGEDRRTLEKHLAECPACRRELEALRGDTALLAISTSGPKPPTRARQRLLEAVGREPRRVQAQTSISWWKLFAVPLAVSVGLLVALTVSWKHSDQLEKRIAELENQKLQQQAELQRAKEIVSTLTATDAMKVTLVAAKTPPQPQGKVMYVKERASLIFMASNLPAVPSQKAYELWLIPMNGAPMPAGMFKPDARGSAMVIDPPLPSGVEAKTFAITIEPESGASTPTMPIVMMGAGE
jgi:anti-sigma-K factor RskA